MNKYLIAIGAAGAAVLACLIGYSIVVLKLEADECVEWSDTGTGTGIRCADWEDGK